MDLTAVGLIAVLLTLVALAVLRSVRGGRRRLLLLIPFALAVVILRWAAYRQKWPELGIAAALSVLALGVWWLLHGRRLPPPSDDNIRVWTPDDPF